MERACAVHAQDTPGRCFWRPTWASASGNGREWGSAGALKQKEQCRSPPLLRFPGTWQRGEIRTEERRQNTSKFHFSLPRQTGAQSPIPFDLEKIHFCDHFAPEVAEHFPMDFDIIFCLPSFCLDNLTPEGFERASLALCLRVFPAVLGKGLR